MSANIVDDFNTDNEVIAKGLNNFIDYLLPHLKVVKNCGRSKDIDCFGITHSIANGSNTSMAAYKNNIILSDGTFLSFISNSVCDEDNLNCKQGDGILVWFDLNGSASPNEAGKDYFLFKIDSTSSGIKFFGENKSRISLLNGCNDLESWRPYCAALIKYDGWKISDDYIW